ncbi:tumor necrosis factor receptor superfamily member 11B isoform X3 [Carettochelys insculpta]|uniref:tumor necrosis factor receptor superfamily member 11B isoform X3 n=1 Tax=Carettochelys insculpta TaxID=44489 RepID=UPI003EB94ABA
MNKFLCCTLVFLDISVKWTTQETSPPKYLHYDPAASRQLMCDLCPPGTYVKQHCTAARKTECAPCPDQYYAEDWNSNEECQYCNTVCTPESDTICQRCPEGFFSDETSSKASCQKHTNCSALGRKIELKGNAVRDNTCHENTDTSAQKCRIDVTLCEEALFRFAVPEKLTHDGLNVLTSDLPRTKVNIENIERIKQKHSSQEQMFQLLKLWKQQNKEQDMVKKIVQDIDLCENRVLKHIGHANLTFEQLNILMMSLPGKKVGKEDIQRTLKLCKPTEQFLILLNLWRIKNEDQDTIKALTHGLKHLKAYHFPRKTTQSLKKIAKSLHSFTMYHIQLYQKLFFEMIGNQVQSV